VIRAEKASDTGRDGHTGLQASLEFLRAGHTLVVTRIDRLARSLKDPQGGASGNWKGSVPPRHVAFTTAASRRSMLPRSGDENLGPAAIARRLGIGRASVYRLLGKQGTGVAMPIRPEMRGFYPRDWPQSANGAVRACRR
jgi:DNA invertase Pin-like site-specific DNA recombinase